MSLISSRSCWLTFFAVLCAILGEHSPDEVEKCLELLMNANFPMVLDQLVSPHIDAFKGCVEDLRHAAYRAKQLHVGGWHHPVFVLTGHVFPQVSLPYGYSPCWEEGFRKEDCCGEDFGPRGNGMCWTEHYTYEFCCHAPYVEGANGDRPDMSHNFVVPAFDANVGTNIKRYGTFHPVQSYELQLLVREGDIVVDAGANLGAYTVSLATRVGEAGAVHSFEPFRLIFQHMTANVALNGLANVYTYNKALGRNFSRVFAYAPNISEITVPASMQVLNQFPVSHAESINMKYTKSKVPIDIIPLDSLKLRRLNLLKIDVEDMEAEVVLGAKNTLRRCHPVVWAESVDHFKRQDYRFVDAIAALDYKCHPVGGWAHYELLCRWSG